MPTGTAPRPPSWQRDPNVGRVVLVIGAAALFVLVALAALFVPSLDHVDSAISAGIRSVGNGALEPVAEFFTFFGSTLFVTLGCVAVGIWMLVRRRWDAIVYLLCCVPLGWLIGSGLKQLIGRARPVGVNLIPLPNEPSLPSGHTVASALFFGAFAVILLLNVQTRGFKKKLITGLVVLATLVGLSRIYLGVHWFGDVLAAWLFALAWWGFCTSVYLGVIARRQEVPV
jgi:membrane-associated phospholipid phosphatase